MADDNWLFTLLALRNQEFVHYTILPDQFSLSSKNEVCMNKVDPVTALNEGFQNSVEALKHP